MPRLYLVLVDVARRRRHHLERGAGVGRRGGVQRCGERRVPAGDRGPGELDALALALLDQLEAHGGDGERVLLAVQVELALERLVEFGGHSIRLTFRDPQNSMPCAFWRMARAKTRNTAAIQKRRSSRARLRISRATNSSPLIISFFDFRYEAMRRTSCSSRGSPFQRRSASRSRTACVSARERAT